MQTLHINKNLIYVNVLYSSVSLSLAPIQSSMLTLSIGSIQYYHIIHVLSLPFHNLNDSI